MIRRALRLIAVLAIALVGERAYAISTLEDVIKNTPRIIVSPYRSPSSNAVLRNLSRPQSGIATNSSLLRGGTSDEGPALDEPLQTVPAQVAPWMVALSEGDDLKTGFACGGVLVAPDWVLSAAHCAFHWMQRWPVDFKPYAFTETAAIGKPGKRFPIAEIVPHPGYDPQTLQNDLVLLRLDVRDQQPSTPIRIEGPPIATHGGNVITLLGWGITTNLNNEHHSQRLQLLQFAVLDDAVCFGGSHFPKLRNASVFCGRSVLKYHCVCFRFGGSPLVLYDTSARLYLAGLVAWPAACPNDGREPTPFVDIQRYVPWIKSITGLDVVRR